MRNLTELVVRKLISCGLSEEEARRVTEIYTSKIGLILSGPGSAGKTTALKAFAVMPVEGLTNDVHPIFMGAHSEKGASLDAELYVRNIVDSNSFGTIHKTLGRNAASVIVAAATGQDHLAKLAYSFWMEGLMGGKLETDVNPRMAGIESSWNKKDYLNGAPVANVLTFNGAFEWERGIPNTVDASLSRLQLTKEVMFKYKPLHFGGASVLATHMDEIKDPEAKKQVVSDLPKKVEERFKAFQTKDSSRWPYEKFYDAYVLPFEEFLLDDKRFNQPKEARLEALKNHYDLEVIKRIKAGDANKGYYIVLGGSYNPKVKRIVGGEEVQMPVLFNLQEETKRIGMSFSRSMAITYGQAAVAIGIDPKININDTAVKQGILKNRYFQTEDGQKIDRFVAGNVLGPVKNAAAAINPDPVRALANIFAIDAMLEVGYANKR